ncbi:MAG: MFS transporter [Deltaproteobacteria bacterium]|nr:MFS transporter [Deltaproteobacteria bacterium]
MSKDRSLFILFSVVALDLVGFGIVMPILPFYAEQYGANAAVLGLLLTSYSAMQFLFSPVWGRFSDRFGRKPTLILTIAGSCLSLVLLGLAHSLTVIFLGRLLSGVFAANISVASATVTDITTDENRSKGMGLIGAAFGIGFLLGPMLGGILSPYGYHIPILTAAGLSVINMVYASRYLREPARHNPKEEAVIKTAVLADRSVARMCLIYFIFTLSITQLESTFAFFMMDRFAYSAKQVGWLLALMALVMIAVQGGLIRRLTHRFGEQKLLLVGTSILAIAFLLIPSAPSILLLIIPLLFASLGRGISQPSLLSLVSKKALPQVRGAVMGTFQASTSLGRVIGPVFAGLLYDHWHSSPYYLAAGLMGLVLIISANRA